MMYSDGIYYFLIRGRKVAVTKLEAETAIIPVLRDDATIESRASYLASEKAAALREEHPT